MPSAPRAFTERITGVGGGSISENVSSQPAGFFASSSRSSRSWNGDHVVPAGDGLDLVHPLQRDLRRHPEGGGDGGRGGRVGLVGAAGQLEVDRPGGAVRVEHVVAGQRPAGRRAAEAALAAEPVVARALQHTAAGRAGPGVVLPLLARRRPTPRWGRRRRPRRSAGRRRWRSMTAFDAGQALAPVLGEHPGLGGAVELVAGEVEQRDGLGRRCRGPHRRGTSRRPR